MLHLDIIMLSRGRYYEPSRNSSINVIACRCGMLLSLSRPSNRETT